MYECVAVLYWCAQNNTTLQCLKLNGNKLGDRGAMYVAQMLQLNTALERLDLGECELGIASLIALATVLRYNTSVRALTLNRPLLWTQQEEHVYHIAQMLKARTLPVQFTRCLSVCLHPCLHWFELHSLSSSMPRYR